MSLRTQKPHKVFAEKRQSYRRSFFPTISFILQSKVQLKIYHENAINAHLFLTSDESHRVPEEWPSLTYQGHRAHCYIPQDNTQQKADWSCLFSLKIDAPAAPAAGLAAQTTGLTAHRTVDTPQNHILSSFNDQSPFDLHKTSPPLCEGWQ